MNVLSAHPLRCLLFYLLYQPGKTEKCHSLLIELRQSHWSLGCITAPKPAGTSTSPSQSAPTRITLFSCAQFRRMVWNTIDWWEAARSHNPKQGDAEASEIPSDRRLRRISWVISSKNFKHVSPHHMWLRLFVWCKCSVPAYSLFNSSTSRSEIWPSPKLTKAGPRSPSAHEIVVVVRGARHPWHVTAVP